MRRRAGLVGLVVSCDRVVVDTNILVAAAYAPQSASRQIVDACVAGRLTAVASVAVVREYELIVSRAIRSATGRDIIARLLDRLVFVEPASVPRVVADDPDDDKLLAAAAAGGATWLVSNDRHLLEVGRYGDVQIVRPAALVDRMS